MLYFYYIFHRYYWVNFMNESIHNLILENRNNLSMSGVEKVINFDDNIIVLNTHLGEMTIKGEKLHISKMDVDTGDLSISGNIYGLIYNESTNKGSVIKRLFK